MCVCSLASLRDLWINDVNVTVLVTSHRPATHWHVFHIIISYSRRFTNDKQSFLKHKWTTQWFSLARPTAISIQYQAYCIDFYFVLYRNTLIDYNRKHRMHSLPAGLPLIWSIHQYMINIHQYDQVESPDGWKIIRALAGPTRSSRPFFFSPWV